MLKIHYVNNVDTLNEWRKTWSIKSSISLRNAIGIHSWPYHSIRPIPLTNNRNRVKNILSVSMPPMKNRKSITYDEYLIVSWLSTRIRKPLSRKIAPMWKIVDERDSPVTYWEIGPSIAKNYVGFFTCSYTFVKRFIVQRFDTFLKFLEILFLENVLDKWPP